MKRIILDTNFLLIPPKFKVDIFEEFRRICDFNYKLYIYDGSIKELERIIKSGSGKDKKSAQLALKLIKFKKIGIIESKSGYVDEAILNNLSKDAIIATLDANLKRKVLEKGAPAIILRQKKYLQMIERKFYK